MDDVASSGGGLDTKVRLSIGKPRRRGVGHRLTLALAPAGHDVPGVDFGFGTSVGSCGACAVSLADLRSRTYGLKFWASPDELSSVEDVEDGGMVTVSTSWAFLSWTGLGPRSAIERTRPRLCCPQWQIQCLTFA